MCAECRAEKQRYEHACKVAGGANGDPVRAFVHGQVLAGELAHGAQDDRLGKRDDALAGHRPREARSPETNEAAGCDERAAGRERGTKPAVEQDPGRDRQNHVEEGEDLGEPPDRAH